MTKYIATVLKNKIFYLVRFHINFIKGTKFELKREITGKYPVKATVVEL